MTIYLLQKIHSTYGQMKNPPKRVERTDRQTKNPPKTADRPCRQKKNPPKTVYTKLYSSRKSTLKAIVQFYLSGHTDTICTDPSYTFVNSASVTFSPSLPAFESNRRTYISVSLNTRNILPLSSFLF